MSHGCGVGGGEHEQQIPVPDRAADANLSRPDLLVLVSDPEDRLTFTCTPWGSGGRIAIDRDEDGVLNGDE